MPIFPKIGVASLIPDVGVEPFVTVADWAKRSPEVLAEFESGRVDTSGSGLAVERVQKAVED